jgi:hypothetical protein
MVSNKKRKSWCKVKDSTRAEIQQWVRGHNDVLPSPNKNDTLLVKDPITGVASRKAKLILYVPVRRLHNDLINPVRGLVAARDRNNKVLISNTGLQKILPPELRAATDSHKQMCSCVNCTISRFHQASLNAFRHRHVRFLIEASKRVVGLDNKAIAVA